METGRKTKLDKWEQPNEHILNSYNIQQYNELYLNIS